MRKVLISTVIIVVCIFIFLKTTGHITESRIQKRIAYWQSWIDSELPIGATKVSVEEWLKQHPNFKEQNPGISFKGVVEEIPVVGIRFPCSSWKIGIDIYIGQEGTYIKREVYQFSDTCM
jgi:hypothetical protein